MIQLKKEKRTKDSKNDVSDIQHLSIQFSLDGFSFCVLNKSKKQYTDLFDYSFSGNEKQTPDKLLKHIEEVFNKNNLLKEHYNTVSVSHINDLATLVPKPLFQKEKLSTYVSYNNKVFQSDFFAFDELTNHDMVNAYVPYVNVNNFFIDRFGGFEYKHFSTVLVENLLNIYKYGLSSQMFVHVNRTHLEIIVIKDKKLQLYNTFKYRTKEDFIYYILFTAEQLKLNPESFKLLFFGTIEKSDANYEMAYKYVRNVHFLENRYKYSFADSFTEEDKRTHFTLLNLV